MIEVISDDRCTGCNICVNVCPTNVFDVRPGENPVIARQDDCQTCFMCEVYCPYDALYVAPQAAKLTGITVEELEARDIFGSYRKAIGWAAGGRSRPAHDVMKSLDHH